VHDARAHAERESQAKSELLAKVSHELRTPLSGIVASAQLLSAETEDSRVIARAETIMGLSKDLLREINDLLDQAKYEARALVLESTLFGLRDQTERLRQVLEPAAVKKNLAFVIDVDPRIEDRIQGDSHYLTKVLMNLAGNAVKFTDAGKVEIAIRLLDEKHDQYRIRFSVQDTGIGIPKDLHGRIFEPFFQADSGTARKYGGTGLGMTISKEIVNLMGGQIQVDSSPGAGSHFHFDLDFRRVKARQKIAGTSAVAAVYGKRILVVDDNATILTLIKEMLLRDRHEVMTAHSGAEALEVLNAHEFDVIFLDFNMGDVDGAKVLQLYRFGRLQAAPVFFLTADVTAATAARLRGIGAAGVLYKPITVDGLRQAVAQVCSVGPDQAARFEGNPTKATPHPAPPSQPPLATIPTQYIDHNVLVGLGSMSERPEFLADVLASAIIDIERNSLALIQAIAALDSERVRDTAHALKGVCASIGATRLETIANRLMRATAEELIHSGGRLKVDVVETSRQSVASLRNALPGQAVNG
jgi:two-component system sensor histidine kinase RpfC